MTGVLYFIVIVLANTIGAVSGMGGGVIIKPVFDAIGAHDVSAISFYSSVAVFVMSIISTVRQIKYGVKVNWKIVLYISLSAIGGGILGNIAFQQLLIFFPDPDYVLLIQIILTIITLVFAFIYNKYEIKKYHFKSVFSYTLCGLLLGFLASLLGIGGGPINVSLLILIFSIPIKEAVVYSLCIILFSQLAKLITIFFATGFFVYDLSILIYIIPAAIIGGVLGSILSGVLSPKKILLIFQGVIILVLIINIINGIKLLCAYSVSIRP